MSNEEAILAILNDWSKNSQENRKDRVLKDDTSGSVIFDVLPPLQYKSTEEYRSGWDDWQPETKEGFNFYLTDTSIHAGDDKAFAHAILHCKGESVSISGATRKIIRLLGHSRCLFQSPTRASFSPPSAHCWRGCVLA